MIAASRADDAGRQAGTTNSPSTLVDGEKASPSSFSTEFADIGRSLLWLFRRAGLDHLPDLLAERFQVEGLGD
jgi:hypothetical protein